MREQTSPDLDSALVLGMASTAIPFARSREEEAERWLRILRLHGEAGAALQALGVSEAPLEAPSVHEEERPAPTGEDVVDARGRGGGRAPPHAAGPTASPRPTCWLR